MKVNKWIAPLFALALLSIIGCGEKTDEKKAADVSTADAQPTAPAPAPTEQPAPVVTGEQQGDAPAVTNGEDVLILETTADAADVGQDPILFDDAVERELDDMERELERELDDVERELERELDAL